MLVGSLFEVLPDTGRRYREDLNLCFNLPDEVVERCRELLGPHWPRKRKMTRATAAILAESVYNIRRHGKPSMLSRQASNPFWDSVRQGYGWHATRSATDELIALGWIDHEMGRKDHNRSWFIPNQWIIDLLCPVLDEDVRPIEDVLELRNAYKRRVRFDETELTAQIRVGVKRVNDVLAGMDWRYDGGVPFSVAYCRIFNDLRWDRGGRWYVRGKSYQNWSKERREGITLNIDGVVHKTDERDFEAHHYKLACLVRGIPVGNGYQLDGYDRKEVKLACLVPMNVVGDSHQQILAIQSALKKKELKRTYEYCAELLDALITAEPLLAEMYGKGVGKYLQYLDSQITALIFDMMIDRTGRAPLSVHDSYIVADIDVAILKEVMEEAFWAVANTLTPAGTTTTTPPIWGKTFSPTPTTHHPPHLPIWGKVFCPTPPTSTNVGTSPMPNDGVADDEFLRPGDPGFQAALVALAGEIQARRDARNAALATKRKAATEKAAETRRRNKETIKLVPTVVMSGPELLAWIGRKGADGVTAWDLARQTVWAFTGWGDEIPKCHVDKCRRRLDKVVASGQLRRIKGSWKNRIAARYVVAT
jgi:hypothetical protein